MKYVFTLITLSLIQLLYCNLSFAEMASGVDYKLHKVKSDQGDLNLALHEYSPKAEKVKGTILLVHGSSFPSKLSFAFKLSNSSWQDYLNNHGFRVYMLDFLGYGDSDRYPEMINEEIIATPLGNLDVSAIDLQNAVNFILEKNQLDSIHLLGHSWGSNVVARYAQNHPNRVKALVLYASIYPTLDPENSVSKTNMNVPAYIETKASARLESLNNLAVHEPLLAPEMYEIWPQMWVESDPLTRSEIVRYPAGPKLDVLKLRKGIALFNPKKIQSDTLVIRGEYDHFPTHEQANHLFENLTSVTRKEYVVVDEGTHVLHLEKNRHQLYKQVLSFISELK